jgi:hypothetical protein
MEKSKLLDLQKMDKVRRAKFDPSKEGPS